MMMRMMALMIFLVILHIGFVYGDSAFYGNEIKERSTSGMDPSITPSGQRIWVDDPLNCESCPRWGYLQYYHVYIHAGSPTSSSGNQPKLYLQIWSNTSQINYYRLKWQKKLENYNPGTSYKIAPNANEVVEVNEYDRIGFTSDRNFNTVALDLQQDDLKTASTAHRTYFRLLYRDKNVLPAVGDIRMTDNNALRGRFSIGITLDNDPPKKSTEVFCGNALIRRQYVGLFQLSASMDDKIVLVPGIVTGFYFRLDQLNIATSVQLHIWRKHPETNSYTLAYQRMETIGPSPEKTHNVTFGDGPVVDGSFKVGWISGKIFSSFNASGVTYMGIGSTSYVVGQTYKFDSLQYNFMTSIGVIIDQSSGIRRSFSRQRKLESRLDILQRILLE